MLFELKNICQREYIRQSFTVFYAVVKPFELRSRTNQYESANIISSYAFRSFIFHQLKRFFLISGPTSGIGLETARVLALRGVHVVMAARNLEAAAKCKETIVKDCPNATIDIMQLDVSSLESVRNFANEFIAKGLPLNILM